MEGGEARRTQPSHIVILSDPGAGHLIPLSSLAKHLHQNLHFSVTLITQPTSLSSQVQDSILSTLPRGVNTISLPHIPIQPVPQGGGPGLFTIANNIPSLREALESLRPTATAMVVDMFSMAAFDVPRELGMPVYLFFPSSASALSLVYHLPRVEERGRAEGEAVMAPGFRVPVEERDLPDPFPGADRSSDSYRGFLRFLKLFLLPKAVLVNSFQELEPGPTRALKSDASLPPVHPVGPFVLSGLSAGEPDDGRCLKWLDEQPEGSVIYVSFGSEGTLSSGQMKELASGLEISGQRFLWVVRSPNGPEASAAERTDPADFMPDGFVERTKGVGLLVRTWAPQMEILGHRSTGGFVTHCGWNSTLESMVNGVPLIAWPLYAEQKLNAVVLTEDLKVAMRVEPDENGVVGSAEIARLVRSLMEGDEGKVLRNRMEKIKTAAKVAREEGGSSDKSFSEIAREWNNI